MTNRQSRRDQNRQARRQKSRPQRGSSPSGPSNFSFDFKKYGFWIIAASLAVGLLVVVIVLANNRGDNSQLNDESQLFVEELHEALVRIPTQLVSGQEMGSSDSPLVLEIFADFQCPHCLRHAAIIEPEIVEKYVKTEKLRLVFKHFPVLGRESVLAASAATCAGEQEKFWIYSNSLFKEKARSGTEPPNRGLFSEENLVKIATDLELDVELFKRCQKSPETLSSVSKNESLARRYGLTGTPSFVLRNGEKAIVVSPSSFGDWEVILNEQLELVSE